MLLELAADDDAVVLAEGAGAGAGAGADALLVLKRRLGRNLNISLCLFRPGDLLKLLPRRLLLVASLL